MKKIAIIGFGVSGQAIARYFLKEKDEVFVYDTKLRGDFNKKVLKDFDGLNNFNLNFGGTEFEESEFDLIMVSPGAPLSLPVLLRAKEKNIPIKNDITLFIEKWREVGPVVGITGSNGKTTIVNLVHSYLKGAGANSILAGNVGNSPLSEIGKHKKGTIAVLELSSYQLESFASEHYLDVCLISNLSSNHLDRYDGSMDKYAQAKMMGIDNKETKVIICSDDEGIKKYVIPKLKTKNISLISLETPIDQVIQDGVYLDSENDLVVSNNQQLFKVFNDIESRKLIGVHNLYNIALTYGVLNKLKVDLSHEQIVRNFKGLEHRIEFVREIDGVKYINDSKSSSPDATCVAIEALTKVRNIILILGGNDKEMKFDLLDEPIRENVKQIILLPGNIDEKIKKTFLDSNIKEFDDLDQSIKFAKDISEKGDIVLLSPAATSFKLYKNYEERGEHFKELVNGL